MQHLWYNSMCKIIRRCNLKLAESVNILGTEYTIEIHDFSKDEHLKNNNYSGYCVTDEHKIVIADRDTLDGKFTSEKAKENSLKKTIRHEIVHAFLDESGLQESSFTVDFAWAINEEMVDWFSLQGMKIYKAWGEAGAL